MVDSMKNPHPNSIPTDLKVLISAARTRRTKVFAYGFVFAFVACTAFLAFNPSTNASSPWFYNLFSSSSASSFKASIAPYRDHVSSLFSHFFPNSSSSPSDSSLIGDHGNGGGGSSKDAILGNGSALVGALSPNKTQPQPRVGPKEERQDSGKNQTGGGVRAQSTVQSGALEVNKQNASAVPSEGSGVSEGKRGKNGDLQSQKNPTKSGGSGPNKQNASAVPSQGSGVSEVKQGKNGDLQSKKNPTKSGSGLQGSEVSKTANKGSGVSASAQGESKGNSKQGGQKGIEQGTRVTNSTNSPAKAKSSSSSSNGSNINGKKKKREKWVEDMIGCDIFHGHWVKDESYPLYPEGSCPHIDEPFDCYLNGRPDRSYQKLRWQPTGCNIPR